MKPYNGTANGTVMEASFVHLDLHSEFSIVDSTIRLNALIARCQEMRMSAVAVTDEMNLFALVRFYKAARSAGIKPICGAEILITDGAEITGSVVLLIENEQGFVNLSWMLSQSWEEKSEARPCASQQQILARSSGLFALIDDHNRYGKAMAMGQFEAMMPTWQEAFGDRLFLRLSRIGRPREEAWIERATRLSYQTKTGLVAVNEVRFLRSGNTAVEAHLARVAISRGLPLNAPELNGLYSDQQFFKPAAEMSELFADLPAAIANSWEIAQRCNFEMALGKLRLPSFLGERQAEEKQLRAQALGGLKSLLPKITDPCQHEAYFERLEVELSIIENTGFCGYFLIVADFISWAKGRCIPVGPGRGSGAGSLVAWALGITGIDPIRHNLLFERFLNPYRVSMPDFDIDFCMERRDEVIDYVIKRYGRSRVAQIITFGRMSARAVIRDCARVLSLPAIAGDRMAKMIPSTLGITLEEALGHSEALQAACNSDDETRSVYALARELEGLVRSAGRHAGGVVIAPQDLRFLTPLYYDYADKSSGITQFDKDDVESLGMVKFDFLGLRTLTIIDWALKEVNRDRSEEEKIDFASDDTMDDPQAFTILQNADTLAIFQCESAGIKSWMRKMQPCQLEDIVALIALYRPGPLGSGMIEDFMQFRKGEKELSILHPDLEEVLRPTAGVFLYQEQVMQCARLLANYSLAEADLLRRAMGKKKEGEMAEQAAVFVSRAAARGVDERLSRNIFDLMSRFAQYGFNRSHSVAYAMITYQTCWLKRHFPQAFYMAVMNSEIGNPERLYPVVRDARKRGISFLPPSVNHSNARFSLSPEKAIVWGLAALKGLGMAAALSVEEERRKRGEPFRNLFDFCQRVNARLLGRKGLECLALSGALDCLQAERAMIMATIPRALEMAARRQKDQESGQRALFAQQTPEEEVADSYVQTPPFPELVRLRHEKALTGCYLSRHPVHLLQDDLQLCSAQTASNLAAQLATGNGASSRSFSLFGEVEALHLSVSRNRGTVASVRIGDLTETLEVLFYEKEHRQFKPLLRKGQIMIITGAAEYSSGREEWILKASDALLVEDFRRNSYQKVCILWSQGRKMAHWKADFEECLTDGEGIDFCLRYQADTFSADFGCDLRLNSDNHCWSRLRSLFPIEVKVRAAK